jgi:hypothetical protein
LLVIYYIARTLGATARGVGILRKLGSGTLVTPWPQIARLERIPWFGGIPAGLPGDVLVFDGVAVKMLRAGRSIALYKPGSKGPAADLAISLERPVLARDRSELDLSRADKWWRTPLRDWRRSVGPRVVVFEDVPKVRNLEVVGGTLAEIHLAAPDGRFVSPFPPDHFYWPAQAVIATADTVTGGGQVQAEAVGENYATEIAEEIARWL